MSFQVFASGTTSRARHFHFRRAGLDIGDLYEAADALQAIATVPFAAQAAQEGVRAGARALAIDQAQGFASTNPVQGGQEQHARQIGAHNMANNLTVLLATRRPLAIFIAVRASGQGSNVSLTLETSGPNSIARFNRLLYPALSATGMNGFGVSSALAEVFSSYDAVAGRGADGLYRLLIQIDG